MIFLLSETLFPQAPDTLWTKTFVGGSCEEGGSVRQTNEGGYIIVGNTRSIGAGSTDIWLIKTNAYGDTSWTKTFGGIGLDVGFSVQQTSDSGFVITGYTYSFGAGNADLWLIKTNANGDTMWTKTFGGVYNDIGFSVQQTSDSGFVITGYTYSFGGGYGAALWLVKTNANGDTLWTKTFGGGGDAEGRFVHQTFDTGYIITGRTLGSLWLIKTDASGDTLWIKKFGGSSYECGYGVQQTIEGGYIVTGYTRSYGAGGADLWLIKTNGNGDAIWTKTFGGSLDDIGRSVRQTMDGGFIIVGIAHDYYLPPSSPGIWLIKTNSNGDTLWTRTVEGGRGYSVQQTADEGYIITGEKSNCDVWLIKVAPDVTEIDENLQSVISNFRLQQNYPNPFNPTTIINYQLAFGSEVGLTIYNLLGKQIRTLVNAHQSAGAHRAQWDGRDESGAEVPSGIYFYRLKTGNDFKETKKMVLMR